MLPPHLANRLLNSWSDIQQKRQRPPYLWCRIDSCKPSTNGYNSSPQPLPPSTSLHAPRHDDARDRVPWVRATSPSQDETNVHYPSPRPFPYHQKNVHDATLQPQDKTMAPKSSPPSNLVQSGLKRRHSSKHLFRPRTFLLSSSLASSSLPVASISGTTRLKSHRKDLAVFMERTKRVPQTQDTLRRTTVANTRLGQIGKKNHNGDDHEYGSSEIPATGAIGEGGGIDSSIELSDLAINPSTWAQDFKESSGGGGPNARIAEQLHQIASPPSLISSQSPGAMSYEPQPKIKPKLPKPRPQKTPIESGDFSGDDVTDGMISPEGEDDFVYDTYIRSSGHLAGIPTDISEPYQVEPHIDNSKIGILIIPDQDQAVWETFGEEEENDKDWNSEEEDENGTCCREKAPCFNYLRSLIPPSRGLLWQ